MADPDLIALFLAAVVSVVLLRSLLGRRAPQPGTEPAPEPRTEEPPPNAILVDGSNVMHWGGDPSEKVLVRVIHALRGKGFAPVVVFDASVGYRLGDRYLKGAELSQMIGLPREHVYVVNKGVVADEVILDLAQTHGLRVVTNDRYRDWQVQFRGIDWKRALVRGTWQKGAVIWRQKGF